MKLYFWQAPENNVGDDLNPWLWPKVFGSSFFDDDPTSCFIGIGSVLTDRHDAKNRWFLKASRRIVFGAGLRARSRLRSVDLAGFDFRFVRGPRSAGALARMGKTTGWISDPAVLTPLFAAHPEKKLQPSGTKRIGFVPYYNTDPALAEEICAATGMILVPPTLGVEPFLATLRGCDHIVAEAMHGAILADAFRIPWMGCRIFSGLREGPTSAFKWGDWMDSLGISARFSNSLPTALYQAPSGLRGRLAGHVRRRAVAQITAALARPDWTLSTDAALDRAQSRILEKADALTRWKSRHD